MPTGPLIFPTDFETILTGTFPAMSKEFTLGISTINELPRRVYPFDPPVIYYDAHLFCFVNSLHKEI